MFRSGLTAALLLAACTAAEGEPPPAAASTAAARSIEGEYVVSFVNEAPPTIGIEGSEPTVTIEGNRIHFQSQCIYADWEYSRDGERLRIDAWDYDEPPVMCARAIAPGEGAIQSAIGGADTIRFVPYGIWFSGDGGTVQMRYVPSAEQIAARDVDLTGSWIAQALDGRDLAPGIELEASFDAIWWEPGCAGQGLAYTIDGAGFDAPAPENPGAVCDIGFPSELTDIWSTMVAADTIESTVSGGVLISGNGRSVLLAPRDGAQS